MLEGAEHVQAACENDGRRCYLDCKLFVVALRSNNYDQLAADAGRRRARPSGMRERRTSTLPGLQVRHLTVLACSSSLGNRVERRASMLPGLAVRHLTLLACSTYLGNNVAL